MGDKRAIFSGIAVAILISVWVFFRIDWAYDDLSHYSGDATPAHRHLGKGFALAAAVGFAVVLAGLAKRSAWARWVAAGSSAAAVVAGGYLVWLGQSNSDKEGFGSGSLIFTGLVTIFLSIAVAWRVSGQTPPST